MAIEIACTALSEREFTNTYTIAIVISMIISVVVLWCGRVVVLNVVVSTD